MGKGTIIMFDLIRILKNIRNNFKGFDEIFGSVDTQCSTTRIEFESTAPIEEPGEGRIRKKEAFEELFGHKFNIAAIICDKELAKYINNIPAILVQKHSERLFWLIHNSLEYPKYENRIGENCHISKYAHVSKNNIIIGNNVCIEENAIIRPNVVISDGSIIRAGCIIGGEGFQHHRDELGVLSITHHGHVFIGKNVEIQYNSCIDKGLYNYIKTTVSSNCRIDNLVQIGHNAFIDEATFIAAGAVIGGYVRIGTNTFVGMNAVIRQHVSIGDRCLIGMNSSVIKNVDSDCVVSGFPARPIEKKEI
jgi:UDP-3-O-[3-hydroxymyristoyl] glucosamine N-acyltransferase